MQLGHGGDSGPETLCDVSRAAGRAGQLHGEGCESEDELSRAAWRGRGGGVVAAAAAAAAVVGVTVKAVVTLA